MHVRLLATAFFLVACGCGPTASPQQKAAGGAAKSGAGSGTASGTGSSAEGSGSASDEASGSGSAAVEGASGSEGSDGSPDEGDLDGEALSQEQITDDPPEPEDLALEGKPDELAESPTVKLSYPKYEFKGSGTTTCGGRILTLTAALATNVSRGAVKFAQTGTLFTSCTGDHGDECVKRANERSAGSVKQSKFTRITVEEHAQYGKEGIEFHPGLVFASSVVGGDGVVYTFDKPLPVSIWTVALDRYSDLATSKKWSAVAKSSARKLHLTMKAKQSFINDKRTEVTLTLTIDEGEADWAIYDLFPVAKISTYNVNAAKELRAISTTSYKRGEGDCDANEETSIGFRMCAKIIDGVKSAFKCD